MSTVAVKSTSCAGLHAGFRCVFNGVECRMTRNHLAVKRPANEQQLVNRMATAYTYARRRNPQAILAELPNRTRPASTEPAADKASCRFYIPGAHQSCRGVVVRHWCCNQRPLLRRCRESRCRICWRSSAAEKSLLT